jgi:Tfp pilus assembly protein PilO
MIKLIIDKIKSIKLLDELQLDNQKLILIFLVSAMVLYVDFSFILKAQFAGLSKNSAEVRKLATDLTTLDKNLKAMEEAKAKQSLSAQMKLSKVKKIILDSQVSALLEEISKTANANDVKILQIKPIRELTASQQDPRFKAIGKLTPFYISLELSAGYHQFGKFLNDLENGQTFIACQDLTIASEPNLYVKQRINLTLRTYVKK